MAKRRPVKTTNRRIPILTLSGGVGRQAPSKRLPSEAQTIENCYVTLERSVSKRSGFEIFRKKGSDEYDLGIDDLENKDLWFHWFDVASNARYLLIIDFNATNSNQQFLWIFRLLKTGWRDISPSINSISIDERRYLTHRNSEYSTAREALRAVAVGQSLLILNRAVKAGFTSEDKGPAWPFGVGAGPIEALRRASFKYTVGTQTASPGLSYEAKSITGDGAGLRVTLNFEGNAVQSVTDVGQGYKLNDVVVINGNTFVLTNPANYMFDLDGNPIDDIDLKGRSIAYYTTMEQDPQGLARIWAANVTYVAGDFVRDATKIFEVLKNLPEGSADLPSVTNIGDGNINYTYVRDAKLIQVEDWSYPVSDEAYLGQALDDFSKIKFPPAPTDMSANNGSLDAVWSDGKGVSRTSETLRALYPDFGYRTSDGDATGRGKVYFAAGSYLTSTSGYYRIISKNTDEGGSGRPFTQKLRSADGHCMFDSKRMPVKLSLITSNNFSFEKIEWDPRTSGNRKTNPGPDIFTKEDGTLRQIEINSMAFYRGRLFLSAADTLFTSQIGDPDNFFFDDVAKIIDSDPIDLQASSNKYARINAMIPFSDYLFINTDSDTQFELLGSENTVTPFTAELAPTAFYATAPLVDPILMGSQIYFFAKQKMYIYYSSQAASISAASEVSSHCPEYLPENFGSVATAGARDSIFFVNEDKKNEIFIYTNRYQGDRAVQNAFHKWILNSTDEVLTMQHFDDRLYTVIRKPRGDGTDILYLERIALTDEEFEKPRIDHRYKHLVNSTYNATYLPETDQTRFSVPFLNPNINEVILDDGWGEDQYLRLTPVTVEVKPENRQTWVTVQGNYTTNNTSIYFGETFTMNIELSQQFVRDDENNIINGVLNLKSMSVRHSNTGNYRIEVQRRGRSPMVTTFDVNQLNKFEQTFGSLQLFETEGEMTAKLMGFASELQVFIKSDYPTPVNISNMEIKAMFRPTYSSVLD